MSKLAEFSRRHFTYCRCSAACCRKQLLLISLATLIMIYLASLEMKPRFEFINHDIDSKCIIPNPDPFDQTIMEYLDWHPPPLPCRSTSGSLFYVNDTGYLVLNYTALGKTHFTDINCSISVLEEIDDLKVHFSEPFEFKSPVYTKGDAFSVKCMDKNNKKIYENLHHKIDFKESIKKSRDEEPADDKYSVLMFGMDSLSRLASVRSLPKTVEYIQKGLNAYILKGYNKVAECTFENIFVLLSGMYGDQIPEKINWNSSAYPLIWKEYHKQGYRTLFAEDWPEQHIFSTFGKRFYSKPVDHYMRPFFLGMRLLQPVPYYLSLTLTYLEGKALKLSKYSTLCYGNNPTHKLAFDYHRQFIKAYENKLKFSFSFVSQLAHDLINFFELADEDILEFFKTLKDGGYLDNTFIFFFGDHGHRYDRIRNTIIGRIEDRMPLMSIVVPEKLKKKHPHIHRTLLKNSKKLVSNFDIHETLKAILQSNFIKKDNTSNLPRKRRISLFEDIPENRTCAEASIPEEYCACYSASEVDTNSSFIRTIAEFAISSINDMLKEYIKCANLKLMKVLTAEKIRTSFQRNLKRETEWNKYNVYNYFMEPEIDKTQRYRVLFQTSPGGGIFESTVLYNEDNKLIKVSGDILRTNRYGNQSHCVPKKKLKSFCFCQNEVR